ncbi:MAG: SMP-30/gluconolactonase/LRE family protein [Thermodesulfobacteriota bacterium]|nr:SMP-30/gluconolactonase/LRE family protein [Thermodesulfobacteriota bacterium]
MKFLKMVFVLAVVFVLIVGGLILKSFHDTGVFRRIEPHFGGQCKAISGVLSSEDITIHPRTGMAFISSDDRRPRFRGKQGRQGAIYAFDLTAEHLQLIDLTADFEQEFHPHGIGLFVGQDGNSSLFVVNHRKDDHSVEIFAYKDKKLTHRMSICGQLMHSPNDIIPIGPRAFYVTNDHGNVSKLGRTLEEYLRLKRSYVLYYDGRGFRTVAKGLVYANGINISHDGKTIYVASTGDGKIYVYNRETETGVLEFRHTIDIGTGVDNVELDETGNLWIGAHPKLLDFVKYAKDPQKLAPSQVLKVVIEYPYRYKVEEIYLSKGDILSGSSVAAVFEDKLLIGSVFDERFLVCSY